MPAVIPYVGLLGLAIVMLVMSAVPAGRGSREIARAAATIENRYAQRPVAADADADAAGQLAAPPGWLQTLGRRMSPASAVATMQRRLDAAGNPKRWNTDRIFAMKGLGLLALGGFGALFLLRSPGLGVLAMAVGAAAGFFLPDLLLYNAALKRQARIQTALPEAMDMLTVCVEAGLGFDSALARVTHSMTGPLAAEFSRALQEMQIGKSRTEALRAMAGRTTVAELRAFVSALVQAGDLGIPVAEVVRQQAKEMRLRRRQRAEEQAQKVPVKILFPLICCLFPALFVIIIGPGAISIMHLLLGGHL